MEDVGAQVPGSARVTGSSFTLVRVPDGVDAQRPARGPAAGSTPGAEFAAERQAAAPDAAPQGEQWQPGDAPSQVSRWAEATPRPAHDAARALAAALARASGAFNVAADPVITREAYAELFGGAAPPLPPRLLRTAAQLTWRARLQPTDGGWVDLAVGLPLLDTARLRNLGWRPRHAGDVLLARFVEALGRGSGARGPLLYPWGAGSGF